MLTIFASSLNVLCGRVFRHQKAINGFDSRGANVNYAVDATFPLARVHVKIRHQMSP
jgi:hypothetical protein